MPLPEPLHGEGVGPFPEGRVRQMGVEKLKQERQLVGRGPALEIEAVLRHAEAHGRLLAGQGPFQLILVQPAQAALVDYGLGEMGETRLVGGFGGLSRPEREAGDDRIGSEIGGLYVQPEPVVEIDLEDVEVLDPVFRHDPAGGLGRIEIGEDDGSGFDGRGDGRFPAFFIDLADEGLGVRPFRTDFGVAGDQHQPVVRFPCFFQGPVQVFRAGFPDDGAVEVPLLDRRLKDPVGVEMPDDASGQIGAVPGVRRLDRIVQGRQIILFDPIDLRRGEPVFQGLADRPFDDGEGPFPFLRSAFRADGGIGRGVEIDARADAGRREGRVRSFEQGVQPVLDDPVGEVPEQLLFLEGEGIGPESDGDDDLDIQPGVAGFGLVVIKRLDPGVVEGLRRRLGNGGGPGRHVRKPVFDEGDDGLGLEIPRQDQDDFFGPVPRVVIGLHPRAAGGFQHRGLADGHPVRQAGSGEFEFEGFHEGPVRDGVPGPFFRQHHLPLTVDLPGQQQGPGRIVPQDQQPLLDAFGAVAGEQHVVDG